MRTDFARSVAEASRAGTDSALVRPCLRYGGAARDRRTVAPHGTAATGHLECRRTGPPRGGAAQGHPGRRALEALAVELDRRLGEDTPLRLLGKTSQGALRVVEVPVRVVGAEEERPVCADYLRDAPQVLG